jgi:selenocysteine lyase/cysteine desulfurase
MEALLHSSLCDVPGPGTLVVMTLDTLRARFAPTRGHLDAATCGLPVAGTVIALVDGVERWSRAEHDLADYDAAVAASRAAFGRIVAVPTSDVAVAAQTAALVGMVATSLPAGAEVLTVEGDFTSVTYPFLVRTDLRVQVVPLAELAHRIGPGTDVVAFSLVQSHDGAIADVDAVVEAAHRVGALTVVDLTQAAGWLPVDASRFDVTVTSAYKWLCAPRGVTFLTAGPQVRDRLRPVHANWYAGADVWSSVYGHDLRLADDSRRFDLSPAWLCWLGATPALEAFADELAGPAPDAVRRHDVALADALRAGLDLEPAGSAIVAVPDPDGSAGARLARAGLRAAARGGCARLSFHVWNDDDDVVAALQALRG